MKCPEWLSIIWKGKMVEINSKGKIRVKQKNKPSKVSFDDHIALSYEEVRGVLKYFNIPEQEFSDWIYGQTCPILPNGTWGYYWYDVNRFVRWKIGGPTPIFD